MNNEGFQNLHLGDPHNFGQFVRYADSQMENIYKPRPVFWEWLFLSDASYLRKNLDTLFKERFKHSPFDLLPTLKFNEHGGDLSKSGFVQRFEWEPDTSHFSDPEVLKRLGSTLSLLFYFGVCDLHKENIAIGKVNESAVFCPLDLECLFNNFSLVSQSDLITKIDSSHSNHGLKPLDIEELNIAAFCQGFADSLLLLNQNKKDISELLCRDPKVWNTPIRIILRSTSAYRQALAQPFSPEQFLKNNFFQEEIEQLKRGDIPYFFRKLESPHIYYYSSPSEPCKVLSTNEVIPQIGQLFFIGKYDDLEKHISAECLKSSVLQLARFFLKSEEQGKYVYSDTTVQFNEKVIKLSLATNKMRIACHR